VWLAVGYSHHEVPGYLAAADVGLLLREPCLVNRVASPVKFAEYLAAGLPVLLTEQIGDYSALAAAHRVGCVIPYADLQSGDGAPLRDFFAEVHENRPAWRDRCRQTAEAELSNDRHCRRVVRVYEGLTG